MTTAGDYLTFLKFYARLFCPKIKWDMGNLLCLGNSQIKKKELSEIVEVLKNERSNGFDEETKQYIDELIKRTKKVYKNGCKTHEEYRDIYRPFAWVLIELKHNTNLNGHSDYAREIVSRIYGCDHERQRNLYDLAEFEKKKQGQDI